MYFLEWYAVILTGTVTTSLTNTRTFYHYDSRQVDPVYTKLMKLFLLSTHLMLLPTSSIVKFTNSIDTTQVTVNAAKFLQQSQE